MPSQNPRTCAPPLLIPAFANVAGPLEAVLLVWGAGSLLEVHRNGCSHGHLPGCPPGERVSRPAAQVACTRHTVRTTVRPAHTSTHTALAAPLLKLPTDDPTQLRTPAPHTSSAHQCWATSCIVRSVTAQVNPGTYHLFHTAGPNRPTQLRTHAALSAVLSAPGGRADLSHIPNQPAQAQPRPYAGPGS